MVQRVREHGVLLVATTTAASAAALIACGGGSPNQVRDDGASTPATEDLVVEVSDAEYSRVSASDAADYPKSVLEDRVITFAEYEAAVLQAVGCASEGKAYLSTGTLRLDASFVYRVAFSWKAADRAEASAAVDDCAERFLGPLQDLWSKGRLGTVPESVYSAARETFWACIENAGISLDGRPQDASSARYVFDQPEGAEVFVGCQERIYAEFRIDSFGG